MASAAAAAAVAGLTPGSNVLFPGNGVGIEPDFFLQSNNLADVEDRPTGAFEIGGLLGDLDGLTSHPVDLQRLLSLWLSELLGICVGELE